MVFAETFLFLAEEHVSQWYTIFTMAFQVVLGFAVSLAVDVSGGEGGALIWWGMTAKTLRQFVFFFLGLF